MIIDDVTIKVKAGTGGAGMVGFSKVKMMLGPTGGKGGKGGDVYLEGVSDLTALKQFRFKKELAAQDGGNGTSKLRDGRRGEDLALKVPVGTIVHNISNGNQMEIITVGQRELIARGGKGGRGNFMFRSATNTTPKEAESGRSGDVFEIRLELKMIADVGLIGLPNAGKSSLLNAITRAQSKVGNYAFTTLEPNLGDYYGLILADIPGLIEGASAGKGLGTKFLRHIERTRVLFHLISAQSQDPWKDYLTVRAELKNYNPQLVEKPEYLFLSKSDEASAAGIEKIVEDFSRHKKNIIPISIIDESSLEALHIILRQFVTEKSAQKPEEIA